MAASTETATAARSDERERVLEILRGHESELRARGVSRLMLFGSAAAATRRPAAMSIC
jgi:predicted nucleotidyltransferase